jgi:hypothetical protein
MCYILEMELNISDLLPFDLQQEILSMYFDQYASIDERLQFNVKPKRIDLSKYEDIISPRLQVPRKIFPFGEHYEVTLRHETIDDISTRSTFRGYLVGRCPYYNTYWDCVTAIHEQSHS